MNWIYVLIPLASAFIGWLANWMAIKLLFYGIFHKRKQQFAERLGRLVSSELISFSDIEQKITRPENIKKILPAAEQHIDEFLRHRLKEVFPMISMFIGDKTINQLKQVFMQELENIFPVVIRDYMGNLRQELDLERIVVDKVSNFSGEKLKPLLSKEFRQMQLLGAALGLIIGGLQVVLIIMLT